MGALLELFFPMPNGASHTDWGFSRRVCRTRSQRSQRRTYSAPGSSSHPRHRYEGDLLLRPFTNSSEVLVAAPPVPQDSRESGFRAQTGSHHC